MDGRRGNGWSGIIVLAVIFVPLVALFVAAVVGLLMGR